MKAWGGADVVLVVRLFPLETSISLGGLRVSKLASQAGIRYIYIYTYNICCLSCSSSWGFFGVFHVMKYRGIPFTSKDFYPFWRDCRQVSRDGISLSAGSQLQNGGIEVCFIHALLSRRHRPARRSGCGLRRL